MTLRISFSRRGLFGSGIGHLWGNARLWLRGLRSFLKSRHIVSHALYNFYAVAGTKEDEEILLSSILNGPGVPGKWELIRWNEVSVRERVVWPPAESEQAERARTARNPVALLEKTTGSSVKEA